MAAHSQEMIRAKRIQEHARSIVRGRFSLEDSAADAVMANRILKHLKETFRIIP